MLPANPFRRIHKLVLQERGMSGDGVSDIEKAQILADIGGLDSIVSDIQGDVSLLESQVYDVRRLVSDTTGATEMESEVEAALNILPVGAVLYVPLGATIRMGAGIVISKEVHIRGEGGFHWTGNDPWNSAGIVIEADNSSVDGVFLTSNGSGPGRAVRVKANGCSVTNTRIHNWRAGLDLTWEGGDWRGFTCTGNIVTDIFGIATAQESDGAGILICGMDAIVSNNVVRAKVASNAWIGIAIDGLASQEPNKEYSYSTEVSNTSFVVTGNIVTGPFRRSIHIEGVSNYTIAHNIAYGFDWWGIIAWVAHNGNISDNQIIYTNDGTGFHPIEPIGPHSRCGILVLRSTGVRVSTNTVRLAVGTIAEAGIAMARGDSSRSVDIAVENNTIVSEIDSHIFGIYAPALFESHVVVRGNTIRGVFFNGIRLNGDTSSHARVDGNIITGTFHHDGSGVRAQSFMYASVAGNEVNNVGARGATVGVDVRNSSLAIIKHNEIINADTGVSGNNADEAYAPGNTFVGVSAPTYMVTSTTEYGP